jgi:hypothetical protein
MVHGLSIFLPEYSRQVAIGIVGRYSSRTKRRLAKRIQAGLWQQMQGRLVLLGMVLLPLHPAPCLQPIGFIGMSRKGMPSLPKMGSRMTKIALMMTVMVVLMLIVTVMVTITSDSPMVTMVTMLTLLTMTTRVTVMMSPMPGWI